jgi:hypothetical protein
MSNLIYCEKVGKPENSEYCKHWFRDEGICVDCPSFDECKSNVEGGPDEQGDSQSVS